MQVEALNYCLIRLWMRPNRLYESYKCTSLHGYPSKARRKQERKEREREREIEKAQEYTQTDNAMMMQ